MIMKTVLSRVVLALGACLLASPPALRAQVVDDLAPGTRVRVVEPGTGRIVGTVSALRGDTLVVLSGSGSSARTVSLPVSSMRSLQVSRGRPSRPASALRGAAIGLASGAVAGLVGATAPSLFMDEPCDRTADDLLCLSTAEWAMFGVLFGAPAGAAWGGAVGFLFPQERWHSISARTAPTLSLTTSGAAVQLGISLHVP
jgi:hypothetical protein